MLHILFNKLKDIYFYNFIPLRMYKINFSLYNIYLPAVKCYKNQIFENINRTKLRLIVSFLI